jgi:hypothetical protein
MTPFLRGIMYALDDPKYHTVAVVKGAQTGCTLIGHMWIANRAALDGGPTLVVYPNENLARSVSQTRVQPLFEDSPSIAVLLPADLKTDWTNLQYRLRTCVVNFVGSNSPASLASRPIRYVLGDEVSKWPDQTGQESDPVNLVRQRQKTFEHNSKAFFISTPTTENDAILRLASGGDMRKYHVECPYCRGWQVMKWANVKFDSKADVETAAQGSFYECEACKKPWTDRDKMEAVAGGEWRGTQAAGDPGVASFHLPSFLAPWVKWSALVRKFLRTKSSPIELQDFVNSELAEPFILADTRIRSELLAEREADYDAESGAPFEAPQFKDSYGKKNRLSFGGIDVGLDYFRCVFREFTEDGESALIWKGTLSTFSQLDELMTRLDIEAACIDARYRADDIYAATFTYAGIWPAKGVGEFRVPGLWEIQTRNVDEGKKKEADGRLVAVLMFDSNALHTMLADRINRAQYAPAWFLFRGASTDAQYVREMTSQYRHEGRWVNPTKRDDHFFDAEALCILAADKAGFKPVNLADDETEKQDGKE